MASRFLTRSAISPRPRTDVRFSSATDAVTIATPTQKVYCEDLTLIDCWLFFLSAIFRDVHDFVLEDEEIGRSLARQANHVLVVILDPSGNGLAVHQLQRNCFLLLSKRLEVCRFLEGIFRRRRSGVLDGFRIPLWSTQRHADIVHNALWPGEPGEESLAKSKQRRTTGLQCLKPRSFLPAGGEL